MSAASRRGERTDRRAQAGDGLFALQYLLEFAVRAEDEGARQGLRALVAEPGGGVRQQDRYRELQLRDLLLQLRALNAVEVDREYRGLVAVLLREPVQL